MADERLRDTDYLRNTAYSDSSRLNARIALWKRYASRRDPENMTLFGLSGVPVDARVLEVGCGPAGLWEAALEAKSAPENWHITLTDLSDGMLSEAKRRLGDQAAKFDFAVADVCDLTFDDDLFDVVVARHMLYHSSDHDRALAEIRRVLNPGGTLFATTNGERHIAEIAQLRERYALPGEDVSPAAHLAFTLEDGELAIRQLFNNVETSADREVLQVDDAELLVGYVDSMSTRVDTAMLRQHVENVIEHDGFFPVTRHTGTIIAS